MPILQQIDKTYTLWRKKKFLFWGGYDYFRLSWHPEIIAALNRSNNIYGINSSGSRATTGNHPLHVELENKLAEFFDTDSAVLLPTGYLANIALLQSIHTKYNKIFVDENIHASIIDAIKLTNKKVEKFKSLDANDLKIKMETYCKSDTRPLIITEGVGLTMNGNIPPLDKYLKLAKQFNGTVISDDAHSVGILGKTGKGTWEHFNLSRKNLIQVGTLSKAFGVYGGFVVGKKELIRKIKNSNVYIGSSAFPLPLCKASIKSLQILKNNQQMILDLQKRSLNFKKRLNEIGFNVNISPTPVINLSFKDENINQILKNILVESKIYPSFIKYLNGPKKGYFRFALSSEHSDEQIEKLYSCLKKFKRLTTNNTKIPQGTQ
ncbi:MAG: pyridoxal phosphate-dependent aminotransferase family protein [Candidatus Marinimicrobia bacterium]|nr:pyridoxal phosphate-dependent aminotransferase family protein [Candidatus Neomarinimicrobiota bacterium]